MKRNVHTRLLKPSLLCHLPLSLSVQSVQSLVRQIIPNCKSVLFIFVLVTPCRRCRTHFVCTVQCCMLPLIVWWIVKVAIKVRSFFSYMQLCRLNLHKTNWSILLRCMNENNRCKWSDTIRTNKKNELRRKRGETQMFFFVFRCVYEKCECETIQIKVTTWNERELTADKRFTQRKTHKTARYSIRIIQS